MPTCLPTPKTQHPTPASGASHDDAGGAADADSGRAERRWGDAALAGRAVEPVDRGGAAGPGSPARPREERDPDERPGSGDLRLAGRPGAGSPGGAPERAVSDAGRVRRG